jgi:hypothetical protein
VAAQMDCIRSTGNLGLHGAASGRRAEWVSPVSAFDAVVKWAEANLWGRA